MFILLMGCRPHVLVLVLLAEVSRLLYCNLHFLLSLLALLVINDGYLHLFLFALVADLVMNLRIEDLLD